MGVAVSTSSGSSSSPETVSSSQDTLKQTFTIETHVWNTEIYGILEIRFNLASVPPAAYESTQQKLKKLAADLGITVSEKSTVLQTILHAPAIRVGEVRRKSKSVRDLLFRWVDFTKP